MWRSIIKAAAVFLLAVFLAPGHGFAEGPAKKRLVVIGVKNEIREKEWNDQLIGYGLSHLLLQKLFDTGRYAPVEDNPEIVAAVQKMIQNQWQGDEPLYRAEDAGRIAGQLSCDAVAYARAVCFATRRVRGLAGPFSGAKTTVEIEIEVYVKEKDKPVVSAMGKGEACTRSLGVFFQIREDKVYFDETTVGKAAALAMEKAVSELRLP